MSTMCQPCSFTMLTGAAISTLLEYLSKRQFQLDLEDGKLNILPDNRMLKVSRVLSWPPTYNLSQCVLKIKLV